MCSARRARCILRSGRSIPSSLESGAHPKVFIFLQVNTWERGRVAALLSLEVANVNVVS
jgi:hypothetical protein